MSENKYRIRRIISFMLVLALTIGLFPNVKGKVYAAPAGSYNVSISGGDNTIVNGEVTQQGVSGEMSEVTYSALNGYYFESFNDIESNGITVTRVDGTTVTVSGTPTSDASVTVPDAVAYPKIVVTGSGFNGIYWDPSSKLNEMTRNGSIYTITYSSLQSGNYSFKFIADENWSKVYCLETEESIEFGTKYTTSGWANINFTLDEESDVLMTFDIANKEFVISLLGEEPVHEHDFEFSAENNVITATCKNEGCDLTDGKATVTIVAPKLTVYGGTGSREATLEGEIPGIDLNDYVISYSEDNTALAEAPADAGNYTASITIEGATASVDYTIEKAASAVASVPEAVEELIENGSEQALITEGSAENGVIKYALGDDDVTAPIDASFTEDIPTASAEGEYYVWYKVFGDDNYSDVSPACIVVSIAKGEEEPHQHNFTFSADGASIIATCTGEGCTLEDNKFTITLKRPLLEKCDGDESPEVIVTGGIDDIEIPAVVYMKGNEILDEAPTEAGNYKAALTIGGATAVIVYYIAKKEAEFVIYPSAVEDLMYNGESKGLITGGTAVDGTVKYALSDDPEEVPDDEAFDSDIPEAVIPGTYYVFYKIFGNDQTEDSEKAYIETSIGYGIPEYTKTPEAIEDLEYTGEELELVTAGESEDGTILYALGENSENAPEMDTEETPEDERKWSDKVPSAVDTGTYYVWYMISGDDNHEDSEPACIENTISESIIPVEPAASENLIYNGENLPLITEGVSQDGVYKYALGENATEAPSDDAFEEAVPEGLNAGKYYVWYKLFTDNSDDYEAVCIEVSISKRNISISGIKANNKEYDGTKNATFDYSEVVFDGIVEGDTLTVTVTGQFTDANAGVNKTVNFTGISLGGASVANYKIPIASQQMTASADITPVDSSVISAPEAVNDLIYNGGEQTLISEGEAEGGSFIYALGLNAADAPEDESFDAEIPAGENAATYYVWYKVSGDINHNSTEAECIVVSIARKTVSISGVKAVDKVYDGKKNVTFDYSEVIYDGKIEGDVLTLIVYGSFADANAGENKTVSFTGMSLSGDDSSNYSFGNAVQQSSATASITPADSTVVTAPEAKENLTYKGEYQELITEGEGEGGTFVYALGEDAETVPDVDNFSDTAPYAMNAGKYYVYYMIKGDSNHFDSVPVCIENEVDMADAVMTTAPAKDDDLTFNGEEQALLTAGETEDGTVVYALGENSETVPSEEEFKADVPASLNSGTFYVFYKILGDDNHYDSLPECIEVTMQSALATISKEPADASVIRGSNAVFRITASGDYIQYRWETSVDGENWINSSADGYNTNKISFRATDVLDGRLYRCVVTTPAGEVISESAKLTTLSVISVQPEDAAAAIGKDVTFKVRLRSSVAVCQWQISNDGGETWKKSSLEGADTSSIAVNIIGAKYNGYLFRCKVTNGTWTEYSDAAMISVMPEIINQPEDATEYYGNIVKFYAKATGVDLKYQWQVKSASGKWINSKAAGNDTAIIRFTSTVTTNNREFRCIITSGNYKLISRTVKFHSVSPIISQPIAVTVKAGATAKFKVKAEGNDISYKWQMWTGTKWVFSTAEGADTDTLSIPAKASFDGKLYRCVVTNGKVKTISNTVKLTVK